MAGETNTVLKHFQIFRNASIETTYTTYADALDAAKAAWADTFVADKNLKDGEFVLFNYKLGTAGKVESILGIVRDGAIDIIGSYDQLTTEYKAYVDSAINALDADKSGSNTNGDITVQVVETDGKITEVKVSDTLKSVAHTGAAADVAVAAGITGLDATNVQAALAELQGDINGLIAIDPVVTTVVEGTGIKVTDNGTDNDHAYTVQANFTVDTKKYTAEEDAVKAGKTYIRIMDGETLISETDAAAFVKDGFLASVTKDEDTNELIFTWNTDAEAGEENQVTKIAIKELCDVYTVGEGLVASKDGYTFSHQAGATELDTTKTFGSGSVIDNKITVNVPSVTVDKFGHVSALSETEVSLEIPESVASAVQTVTGDNYVTASKNGTKVTLATKTKAVADATADANGLATALDVKTYVDGKINDLDAEVTSTDETNVQVKVTEVDGKITAVNVTTDNTINATGLKNAIEALDATVRGTSDGEMTENSFDVTDATGAYVAVEVVETDGKLTAVNVKENIDETIQAKIDALDTPIEGVSSAATNNVKVTVKQVDGIVNSVEVVDNSVNANDVATAITTAIEGLNATVSNVEALTNGTATNDIRVEVVETDGVITAVNVTDKLAKVAHSGAAADVTYTRGSGENATNMTVQEVISALEAVDTWDAGTY